MSRTVLHRSKVVVTKDYTRTTTLCGRMALEGDGMNVAENDEDVTCKFCLRLMRLFQILKPGSSEG